MRGRLIVPFLAKIARIDTDGSAAAPVGHAGYSSGFDDVFKEPMRFEDGTSGRKETAPQFIPCQIEVTQFDALHETAAGDDPDGSVILVFHFQDLEDANLVDAGTGAALLRKNDRLLAIHRYEDEGLIQSFGDGYFCTEAQPQSFGLSGGERNLLLCTYKTRDSSIKAAGVSA